MMTQTCSSLWFSRSSKPEHLRGPVSESEFVLLDSFPTPHQAHLAANALRAVHIPVKIVDESTVSALPHLELALGGVKLYVPESDVEDAERILRGDADLAEQPYREPAEDSLIDEFDEVSETSELQSARAVDDDVFRAFRASIVGLLLCPFLLHLYSASLLLQLPSKGAGLSHKARQRARIAWGINVVVIILGIIGLIRYLG